MQKKKKLLRSCKSRKKWEKKIKNGDHMCHQEGMSFETYFNQCVHAYDLFLFLLSQIDETASLTYLGFKSQVSL